MRKEINVIGMMLAVLLSFGLLATGCDTGGGGGESDPVAVDLTLPAISSVSSFSGNFVNDESEAAALAGEAIQTIMAWSDGLTDEDEGSFNISSALPNIARTVYSDSYVDKIENEEIAAGVTADGYVQMSYKVSMKNENYFSIGDYNDVSMKIKLVFNFDNAVQNNVVFHDGKFTLSSGIYMKEQITSVEPYKATYNNKINVSEGFAMSVSKDGKGIKFVIKMSGKLDFSLKNATEDEYDAQFDMTDFSGFLFNVDIYDNTNLLRWHKTFTDEDAMGAYFGIQ